MIICCTPASQVPSTSRASEACMASRRWSTSPMVFALSETVATTLQLTHRVLTALVKHLLIPFLFVVVAITPSLGAFVCRISSFPPLPRWQLLKPPIRTPPGHCTPHACLG